MSKKSGDNIMKNLKKKIKNNRKLQNKSPTGFDRLIPFGTNEIDIIAFHGKDGTHFSFICPFCETLMVNLVYNKNALINLIKRAWFVCKYCHEKIRLCKNFSYPATPDNKEYDDKISEMMDKSKRLYFKCNDKENALFNVNNYRVKGKDKYIFEN